MGKLASMMRKETDEVPDWRQDRRVIAARQRLAELDTRAVALGREEQERTVALEDLRTRIHRCEVASLIGDAPPEQVAELRAQLSAVQEHDLPGDLRRIAEARTELARRVDEAERAARKDVLPQMEDYRDRLVRVIVTNLLVAAAANRELFELVEGPWRSDLAGTILPLPSGLGVIAGGLAQGSPVEAWLQTAKTLGIDVAP